LSAGGKAATARGRAAFGLGEGAALRGRLLGASFFWVRP